MGIRLAPNGKPSNLSEQQWLQVRTPEFKAWFGDWEQQGPDSSMAVDENGEPMILYHGTKTGGFAAFRLNERGLIFAASSRETAVSYAGRDEDIRPDIPTLQRGVYQLFLNIRDPITVDFNGASYYTLPQIDGNDVTDALGIQAMRIGKDGAILREIVDDGGELHEEIHKPSDIFIVFDPNQVRLALVDRLLLL